MAAKELTSVIEFWPGAHDLDALPSEYESWSAAQKQDYLWQQRLLKSRYDRLPPLRKIDVIGLFRTALRQKMDRRSDQAPARWQKAIHAHGSVAQIKFAPIADSPYTGLFQGVDHGLLRVSVTGDPSDRGFAPGLALKFFVDGHPSENVSALVSLTGQGQNYNFFAHEFSNIVPVVHQLGPRLINLIFRRVSRFPTKISLEDCSEVDQHGQRVTNPRFPGQIFLHPTEAVQFAETPHDFREAMAKIPVGTHLFAVYGVTEGQEGKRNLAQLIGNIHTTSEFVASFYGDSQLFFRHQRFKNR
ncbi:hypothetical protein C7271_25050 [filamentous cyanobacterium CCP5]|nr:hypothetical protein C7271_25050 [filamentous cyanobacterium CCP5]